MTDLRTAAEKALAFLEFYTLNDSAEEWRGNVADALRAALAAEAPQPPPLRFADIRELRTACAMQGLSQEFEELLAQATAAPPQVQRPLTERELQLIDGMIEVQRHHADQCDRIANRVMAEKQKGWDMERVDLLLKLRASGITNTEPQP